MQGYYRRADAKMVLGKHKEAVRDFQIAAKGASSDPDLKRKLSACQKELQMQRFAKAVARALPNLYTYPITFVSCIGWLFCLVAHGFSSVSKTQGGGSHYASGAYMQGRMN